MKYFQMLWGLATKPEAWAFVRTVARIVEALSTGGQKETWQKINAALDGLGHGKIVTYTNTGHGPASITLPPDAKINGVE